MLETGNILTLYDSSCSSSGCSNGSSSSSVSKSSSNSYSDAKLMDFYVEKYGMKYLLAPISHPYSRVTMVDKVSDASTGKKRLMQVAFNSSNPQQYNLFELEHIKDDKYMLIITVKHKGKVSSSSSSSSSSNGSSKYALCINKQSKLYCMRINDDNSSYSIDHIPYEYDNATIGNNDRIADQSRNDDDDSNQTTDMTNSNSDDNITSFSGIHLFRISIRSHLHPSSSSSSTIISSSHPPLYSLSKWQIRRFVHEGYLHLSSVVDDDKIDKCIRLLDHHLGKPGYIIPGGGFVYMIWLKMMEVMMMMMMDRWWIDGDDGDDDDDDDSDDDDDDDDDDDG